MLANTICLQVFFWENVYTLTEKYYGFCKDTGSTLHIDNQNNNELL